jgi:ribosomal protein L11 methyltransferase
VIVVIATNDTEMAGVAERLRELSVPVAGVVSVSDVRRLVLARVIDEGAAERLAVTLRAENLMAVARPDGGPRLHEWRRHTAPITFGPRLSICVAWSEHDRRELTNLVELGPGGFGNGDHPSTRLLLEALLARVAGGEFVLDVGCGSGVLGLAALRLGAREVVALDVDASAVEAARRNAGLNGMDQRVEAMLAPLGDLPEPFDVVVANVGRAALVDLAPQLVRLVAPNGWLAVSGFFASQPTQVAEFLRPLVERERHVSGEWAAVVLGPVDNEPAAPNAIV